MEVEVNLWAVLLATIASMVVGSVWYAPPVFGKKWMKLAKLDEKQMQANGMKPIVISIVASFVTAYVLAHFMFLAHQFYAPDYSFLATSLITATWAWLGFTAFRIITHDVFEGRRKKLTLLNITHELTTFLAMGLVIGLMG